MTAGDVMQMTLDKEHRVTPLVASRFNERNGVVSPDGRWLAYEANDTGRYEIWVRTYPDVDSGLWQVTTTGGTRPLWAPNGQELFYVSQTGALMRVGIERNVSWAATPPTEVVKEGYFTMQGGFPARSYDISPDARRFLLMKMVDESVQGTAPATLIVVEHWVEELKRRVPRN
jgi:eukaryotic-like serine/threonine-protein kinase